MDRLYPMIDAWVNPNFATDRVDPTVARLFPGLEERRRKGTSLSELIEQMDAAGVERVVLCAGYRGADSIGWVQDAVESHPDRFAGSLVVDPRLGMDAVRALERAVRDHGFVMARVMALETQLPYDHASYFPVYAKCVELGVPISVNVGIPGPRVPGRSQDPIALDEVCYFFPELKVIMAHGGDPWAEVCVKLMRKWDNLYYMSSAYSPRRIPQPVLDYLNTQGSHKVMWASDYPILEFEWCRQTIDRMTFADAGVKERFVYGNAKDVIFPGSLPPGEEAVPVCQ
ncbi:amidohydrolase family protein [Streptomyces sp. NPDC001978]|uniref:amidohydrolase family protein n=1 Tax=Streptomyces sp. NPDC001978 TaxID=3364627 RepID=UPI0036C6EA62